MVRLRPSVSVISPRLSRRIKVDAALKKDVHLAQTRDLAMAALENSGLATRDLRKATGDIREPCSLSGALTPV